jgi:cytosine/adenosine deaminase-related metal-dependent hydrolase
MISRLCRILSPGRWFALGLVLTLTARATAATDVAEVDLLITNGQVFPMDAARSTIPGGFVAIRGARIVAVGSAEEGKRFRAARTIDARGGIVMPGMINTHTHAAMTVFRGLGDDVADRLRRFIWPLEAKVVDADLVYWGSLHGMIEMVEGGVTSLVDSYPFPESTTRAARELGMRAFIAYPMKDDFAPFRAYVESLRGDPLITPVVGLHSPYAETPERIRAAAKLADELGLLSTMHVSEMDFELKELREKYNQTPIQYLDSLGLLGSRFLAAHAIFLTESDIALLAKRDVAVAHNMVANIKSAKGVAPVLKLRAAGVKVGLGTDGPMSGNTLDLIGQLGYVAKLHKLDNKDRTVMPAIDVVEMATLGGARALRREKELGSLEPGKLADIIIVETESTAMVPLYDIATNLVYSASPRDVRTTIIHGRVVMEDRRLTTVDPSVVRAKVREIMQRVRTVVPDVK